MQEISPYRTRRASLLRGDGDSYLYLEDLVGPEPETTSVVWVANHVAAPTDASEEAPEGTPPRMSAGGTSHPAGCPELDRNLKFVWFEEGDAVALLDGSGVLAVIPGWAGRDNFYGYSRYARGRSPLAWELTEDAHQVLKQKVGESREFWSWRTGSSWPEIRQAGQQHLEQRVGPQDSAWPVGESMFPELIATRHRLVGQNVWVTATTGLSAQRMAGVEQYLDVPESASRIELAIARAEPDQAGVNLLGALGTVPFGRCTWLGEGHTIGGIPGAYPEFGLDKAALLLTAEPPFSGDFRPPNLNGLVRRGDPVTYLWVLVVDEETFRLARGRDSRAALAKLTEAGATWVQ